jgi:uncharacterized membrane protein
VGGMEAGACGVEDALVAAFIIEELEDGRFTVFVPSIPTPLAGAVYILSAERVHPLNVPFTKAIKTISRWGSGSKDEEESWPHRMRVEVDMAGSKEPWT